MLALPPAGGPIRVAFLLVDAFSLVPFVAAVEPMRMANRIARREVFAWRLLSETGAPVQAINGMRMVADGRADEAADFPNVVVTSGFEPRTVSPRWLLRVLRAAARRGATLGALGTGTFHLARAGQLAGRRATVHWEYAAAFEKEFPGVRCTGSLFEVDSDRMTCCGGTASLDMMLYLLGEQVGRNLAQAVSETFVYGRPRSPREVQKALLPIEASRAPVELGAAVSMMQRESERRVDVARIARDVGVSRRQLQRLFARHLGKGPLAYANELRLQRARSMVRHSGLDCREIAELCGFASPASFSRAYRAAFGSPPLEDRRAGQP